MDEFRGLGGTKSKELEIELEVNVEIVGNSLKVNLVQRVG